MNLFQYLTKRAERLDKRRIGRTSSKFLGMSFRDWLGAFMVTAFIGVLFYLLKFGFPVKNEQLIVYMLGQLSGFVGTILALHYGANKHDEQRGEDMTTVLKTARDAAAAARTNADANAEGGDTTIHEGDDVTLNKKDITT